MSFYRRSANPPIARVPKTPWWRLLRALVWSRRMVVTYQDAVGFEDHMFRFKVRVVQTKWSTLWLRLRDRWVRRPSTETKRVISGWNAELNREEKRLRRMSENATQIVGQIEKISNYRPNIHGPVVLLPKDEE